MLLLAAAMLQPVKASWKDSQDRSDTPGMGPSNSTPQKIFSRRLHGTSPSSFQIPAVSAGCTSALSSP